MLNLQDALLGSQYSKAWLQICSVVTIEHTFCEANQVADHFAGKALMGNFCYLP